MIDPEKLELGSYTPITGWYDWYAWFPVETADRGWKWLIVVKKRRLRLNGYDEYKSQHVSRDAFEERDEE